MFFARKFLFANFLLLCLLYAVMVYLGVYNIIYFDFFYGGLVFIGFYLLLKSICFYSDSSFFFGTILFIMGLMMFFDVYTKVWVSYPIFLCLVAFITYVFFESKLMKVVFYCSLGLIFLSLIAYFLFMK